MSTDATKADLPASVKSYARYLTLMAGLGGLLYGVDVGIIASALPYIEQTLKFSPQDLSLVVAAVLAGSVISAIIAGQCAEMFGRKSMIIVSAALFSLSIPCICFSNTFLGDVMGGTLNAMIAGRVLQGFSAGFIGVVIPMYLAECLDANARGKGAGMFQFLLTVGLVFAALIGICTTKFVGAADDALVTDLAKEQAWQTIFWCSILPGILLFFGAFRLKESPRWLYRRGRHEEALASLASNNGDEAAQRILDEMIAADKAEEEQKAAMKEQSAGDSLFQRKYIIPFVLAVVILGCNQATGVNSMLNYSVTILMQSGLEGEAANWADFAIKVMNMLMTIVAVTLVDKKGRKFLLKMGTAGIICGLLGVAGTFYTVENKRVDVTDIVKAGLIDNAFTANTLDVANKLGNPDFVKDGVATPGLQLIVTYSQGGSDTQKMVEYKTAPADATPEVAATVAAASTLTVEQAKFLAPTFMDKMCFWSEAPAEGTVKEVSIISAQMGVKPDAIKGWTIAGFFIVFISFFAAGPGVCVWLALSELMPTRIRANGMAIAMLINQGVSTTIAGVFLPWVASAGYSGVFFTLAGFTVIYFITAAFFLPETKGRTLEEIEKYFATGKMPEDKA